MIFEMFMVAAAAITIAPLSSPPCQCDIPPTVSGPLPFSAPPVNVRLLTTDGVPTVTAAPTETVAVSAAPGTWLGDQFAATFQFPPEVFVQVKLAATAGARPKPMTTSSAAIKRARQTRKSLLKGMRDTG